MFIKIATRVINMTHVTYFEVKEFDNDKRLPPTIRLTFFIHNGEPISFTFETIEKACEVRDRIVEFLDNVSHIRGV